MPLSSSKERTTKGIRPDATIVDPLQPLKDEETRGRPLGSFTYDVTQPPKNIDMLNLREMGTRYIKCIRVKESDWMILHQLKQDDPTIKTFGDVITMLLVFVGSSQFGDKERMGLKL